MRLALARLWLAGIVVLLAGITTPAQAQIYSWRDAAGTLVLSDRPLSPDARSFAVPQTTRIRTTKPTSKRQSTYDTFIEEQAEAQQVRADLIRAVIQVESAFNPRALSSKGAMGLMQLMPGTASDLGLLDAFDPAQNIRGGVAYLRSLLNRFSGNEELALAAYNAGPMAVTKYGNRIPPYRETRDYVEKIRNQTSVTQSEQVTQAPAASATQIYKSFEVVNGRRIARYSASKPEGEYEIIGNSLR